MNLYYYCSILNTLALGQEDESKWEQYTQAST